MADPTGERERIQQGTVRVALAGELDLRCLPELRTTLQAALRSRRTVFVDLSGITFLDALCLQELVVQYQLHTDRLVLWRPSSEVKLTLTICELEDWVSFPADREAASHPLASSGVALAEQGGRCRKETGDLGASPGLCSPFERRDA